MINKKGQQGHFFEKMIVFFITWLISCMPWAIILDGTDIIIAGFITGLLVIGAMSITWSPK